MPRARVVALEDILDPANGLVIEPSILIAILDGAGPSIDDGLPQIIGDSREVRFRGEVYRFPRGDQQRRIILYLHQQALVGVRAVSTAKIVADLDLGERARIRDIFKRHKAWEKLIQESGGMCSFCWEQDEVR